MPKRSDPKKPAPTPPSGGSTDEPIPPVTLPDPVPAPGEEE